MNTYGMDHRDFLLEPHEITRFFCPYSQKFGLLMISDDFLVIRIKRSG